MDNKFLKDDLIERYVLNQLNDEELATFRGQLMFDETLRKQVVETKMLMNGLATIAGESIISNPSSASKVVQMPASNNRTMLRAAMVIGVLMLAGLSYYFYNSSTTSTTASSSAQEEIQENVEPPIQVDEESPEEENAVEPSTNETDVEKVEEKPKERIFAEGKTKRSSKKSTKVEDEEPEMVFGIGNTSSNDNGAVSFFEEEIVSGMVDTGTEEVNEFIEDAITNSTTKSRIGIVKIKNFQNSDVLKRNKYNAVELDFEGTIDTKASNNKKYVFKLFNNNKDAFISNTPLYKEALQPLLLGTEQYDFKIEENIELKPGLYYFTIEEEVDSDQDMIYAGRFYVSAGKFHVK